MADKNELAEKLAMMYLERTCDISSMTVDDITKKYFEILAEFKTSVKENAPTGNWLY